MENIRISKQLPVIGWREWVSLPYLRIQKIKAKIDTGAKTSAIHAFNIKYEKDEGKTFIKFDVYNHPNNTDSIISIKKRLVGKASVKSSNGLSELRPVIKTKINIGDYVFPIKITLTKRHNMKFRLLIGREALNNRFVVDTGHSYLH